MLVPASATQHLRQSAQHVDAAHGLHGLGSRESNATESARALEISPTRGSNREPRAFEQCTSLGRIVERHVVRAGAEQSIPSPK
jgi:hypothetical protein